MTATKVKLVDQTTDGQATHALMVEFFKTRITAEELIRKRVTDEVRDYNRAKPGYFKGLVQPTDAEQTLNGYKLRKERMIDADKQSEMALQAFQENRFLVLVGDRQVQRLDEEIELALDTQVSFVKLVPLVGG